MKYSLPVAVLIDFSQFVAQKLGLNFPEEKWIDLERAVKEIARLNHFVDLTSCIHWLMYRLPVPLQIELLSRHLTIGETYFFREKPCFDVLENYILPELINQKKNKGKTLRIWSAPCSSGEEPYSIAVLLMSMIPNIQEWNITILASDVNATALHKMKQGVYTDWSFRETVPSFKSLFFNKLKNNSYEILPKIKKMVTPLNLNLSQDCFPQILNGTNAMDLIFCRNMLMYFVPEHREKVVDQFYDALVDGGHLVVGVSEFSLVQSKKFTAVNYPKFVVFKKSLAELHDIANNQASNKNSLALLENAAITKTIFNPDFSDYNISFKEIKKKKSEIKKNKDILSVRENVNKQFHYLANQGKLKEALSYIDTEITQDRCNSLYYFYKALLLLELNQIDKAAFECKNAIYLNPDFVLPYFTLGNISQRLGHYHASNKYYQTVLELLKSYDNEEILPGSEGLSTWRMKQIIDSIQTFNT
ncbi:MAG: hypothetical protein JSS07_10005 [Proteobacteria bacterium]|nr:hypothetical protein [Pseudomonadota bacterium]